MSRGRRSAPEFVNFDGWVEERLPSHTSSGDEILTDCPWCGKPKMYVNRNKGVFHCHVCLEKGRADKLVAKVEGETIDAARKRLEGRVGDVDTLKTRLHRSMKGHWVEPEKFTNYKLPREFTPCFNGLEWRVPEYLELPLPEGRDIDDDAIVRHAIGYAMEGKYRDRIIVPIIHGSRHVFLARLMGEPREYRWKNKEGKTVEPPKYLTPKNAGLATLVYWLDHVPTGADLIIVEGIFDAIRLLSLGFNAVATFGKYLSVEQRKAIIAKRPRRVTFLRDDDATASAWQEARALRRLAGARGLEVLVAECPAGEDPDSLGSRRGAEGVERVLSGAKPAGSRTAALHSALEALRRK